MTTLSAVFYHVSSTRFKSCGIGLLVMALVMALVTIPVTLLKAHESLELNDYPTVARADYIFGCMASNGQTRQALENCSCSIDLIATILPYETYVKAETVLSVRRVGGEKVAALRVSARAKNLVKDLRRAQAEADIRCFK